MKAEMTVEEAIDFLNSRGYDRGCWRSWSRDRDGAIAVVEGGDERLLFPLEVIAIAEKLLRDAEPSP